MNKADHPRVNNMRVLDTLARLDPNIAAIRQQLRAGQRAYFSNGRDPSTLIPMGLLSGNADWLRERYASARAGDGLAWIKSLRERHDLDCCPMCGGTGVAQLDHLLPKAYYPEFAIFSWNLVPTCGDCNRRRSNKGSRYHFVHPYFDTALLDRLRLSVVFRQPYDAVRFSLSATGVADADLIRVNRQIEETLPILLFRRRARRCWREWHGRFQRHGRTGTMARLLDDLEFADANSRNSWEVAFMRGLSTDTFAQDWMVRTSIPSATAATPPPSAIALPSSHATS